jgi:hypothetical protein
MPKLAKTIPEHERVCANCDHLYWAKEFKQTCRFLKLHIKPEKLKQHWQRSGCCAFWR